MPALTLRNIDNSAAIRWLAKTCHFLTEGTWRSELPVIYDGADFSGYSEREANCFLFDAVRRNGNIESITLKNLELNSKEVNLLANVFSSNPFLHTLTLSNVSMAESEDSSSLWNAVSENSNNVTTMTLNRCKINLNLSLALGRMIRSGSLKCLKLSKVDLIDPADVVKSISECGLSRLEIRSLRMDQLYFSRLFESLKANSKLESLVVTRCGLGSEAAQALAELLSSTQHNIATLNISENNFDSEGIEILTRQGLQHNKSLERLILSHNPIGDSGAKALAEWLCEDRTLKSLSLIDCEIWGPGCVALGAALKRMRGLEKLMVDSEFDDHVDVVLASMESNMSLTRLSTDRVLVHDDPKWERVEFYLKLNRAKRRMLTEGDVPASLWPRVLAGSSGDASVLFYLLQHKPELASR
jgi:Ran GTPase-activating protein (RanGAP) involved in mRNA processing and transport